MVDEVLEKMVAMFGDNLVDPEVYPKQSKYQFMLSKYQIAVESSKVQPEKVVASETTKDQPENEET